MIDLTVKTLDSQNHAFSLDDDQITVRGFKEYIAESVAVPADSQRLIYCGRVLQDEKKLNDYDVNGKVIHLVQRAPPQPGQRGNDSGQSQGQDHGQGRQNQQRSQFRLTRTQTHANAMYMGTMSLPAEIVDGHVLPVPPLSNSLSNSRLLVARRMLDRCNELMDRLDDPNAPLNTNTSDSDQTPLPQEVQIQEIETDADGNSEGRGNLGARLATAAAIAAVLHGADNVTVLRGNSDDGDEPRNEASNNDVQGESQGEQQSQSEQGTTSNSEGQGNRRPQLPRPPQLAELLDRLISTQHRLRPYMERYRVLMHADPSLPPGAGPEGVEENQRIVDGVSETLHYLSHACHALSDIIVDMRQQPPRNLRCRPIIIQHSAILQAGIPIQARISLYGRNGNNNNGNEETNDSAGAAAQSETTDSVEPVEVNIEGASQQSGEAETTSQTQSGERQAQADQTQTPFGTLFNLPNNVEVLMEVSPESNMETIPESEPNQNNENNNNNNNNTANNNNAGRISGSAAGVFPWGSAPPPDFIRNLMQVVAGHMVQNGIATTTIATRTTPTTGGQQTTASTMESANATGGQSTVARSNVGTHPTTATQTRSTSRPHVFHQHTHPLSLGLHMNRVEVEFDPFLSCNSHHVRRTPSTTANTTTTTATSTTTASQTARTSQAPVQETQTQSQPAMSATTSSTSSSSSGSGTAFSNTASSTASQTATNNAFMNLIRMLTINNTNDSEITQSLNEVMQMFGGGNVQIGYLRDRRPISGLTLAELMGQRNTGTDFTTQSSMEGREESLLNDLSAFVAQHITFEGVINFRLGRWEPLIQLLRPLREYFQRAFPSAISPEMLQEQVAERVLSQVRPHLRTVLTFKEDANSVTSRVDICATVESILNRHIRDMLKLLFDNDIENSRFAQEFSNSINQLERQVCSVLQYTIPGGQAGLEAVVSRFLASIFQDAQPCIRQWLTNECLDRFRAYFSSIPPPSEADVLPLLVYKNPPQASSTASPVSSQVPQTRTESEPMETEPAEEPPNVVEASMAEDNEEIPETFPGHEALPSAWVPIIARDGVRQRRQLQGMTTGDVTPFSDAYLGSLPSKRRKLIEQQKPRLLVSPTPNHSAITASVERLVREGVSRAGVEEVEGAAVAVATDPGVRRAFGQAIRDCLTPHRYGTPDFPDPLRFPNATKYFADQEKPPK